MRLRRIDFDRGRERGKLTGDGGVMKFSAAGSQQNRSSDNIMSKEWNAYGLREDKGGVSADGGAFGGQVP